jgi:hypothetical protein
LAFVWVPDCWIHSMTTDTTFPRLANRVAGRDLLASASSGVSD